MERHTMFMDQKTQQFNSQDFSSQNNLQIQRAIVKNSARVFCRYKLILKFIWKGKESRRANFEKKRKWGNCTILLKTYYVDKGLPGQLSW